jgi:F-type H+-transporting ATPase subunit delta
MLDPVTNRYAEALFGLAKKEGALDAVRSDVERLARELSSAGGELFFDARVPLDKRREKVESVTTAMHRLTRNFVGLLFEKRREEVLRQLGEAFHRRDLVDRQAAEGVVESARALGAGEIAGLATALGAKLGKTVTLANQVVPDLVGGVRVIVDSRMVDYSLRGRLDGLEKRLNAAPLPSLTEG